MRQVMLVKSGTSSVDLSLSTRHTRRSHLVVTELKLKLHTHTPVSYTHLDVYKRQVKIISEVTLTKSPLQQWEVQHISHSVGYNTV